MSTRRWKADPANHTPSGIADGASGHMEAVRAMHEPIRHAARDAVAALCARIAPHSFAWHAPDTEHTD